MMIPRLRFALLLCAIASGAALGIALGSERYGGLVPCALCLVERWPYRIAAPLALIGMVLPRSWGWVVLWLCMVLMLAAAVAGFVHVGVEHLWWPSPLPECIAPDLKGLSMAERLARMPAHPSKPCDEPTYLVPFLPVSMAEMNMIFALVVMSALSIFAFSNRRSVR